MPKQQPQPDAADAAINRAHGFGTPKSKPPATKEVDTRSAGRAFRDATKPEQP